MHGAGVANSVPPHLSVHIVQYDFDWWVATLSHDRLELNWRWGAALLAETPYLGPSVVVFRAVTPCSLIGGCLRFGVTACIFRVEKWPTLRVTAPVACLQSVVTWSVYLFHIRQSRVCISDRRPVVQIELSFASVLSGKCWHVTSNYVTTTFLPAWRTAQRLAVLWQTVVRKTVAGVLIL
jgi:hypothetical protein